jgi:YD repeat-containing protein
VIAVPTTKETCTITARYDSAQATSAPTQAQYRVNGGSWQTVSFTQITANKQVATVQAGGASGGHKVEAFAMSPTGKQSSTAAYSFGFGSPSLTTPNATVTTHGVVNMRAVGAPKGSAASVTGAMQWRLKGDTVWNDLPATVTTGSTETVIAGAFDSEAILAANPTLPQRTSIVFQIRAKLVYAGSSAIHSNVREVIRVPHAFGSGFPVADVEGGQLALWTGELQVTDSDADLTTPSGGLSISRTHSTFAGDASPASGVFGPGWTASLDGGPSGVSDMELADNTRYDGTLVLFDAEGSVLPFAPANATRRTGATIPTGAYLPVGPDAQASELTVTVSASQVVVKDTDGFETLYKVRVAPTATKDAEYAVDGVTDTVTAEKTAYKYDSAGRVTDIIAPLPDGVTSCVPGTLSNGCRVLRLTYADVTVGGVTVKRLNKVTAQVNLESKQLASFAYDTSGRLVSQTDTPTGLVTTYTWTGTAAQPKLASITPAGQATLAYAYDTQGRLSKVTRPVPASAGGGTAQLAAMVYGHAPSAIGGLSLTQFSGYNLSRTATKAFAVFGPDAVISSAPTSTDAKWRRADLWLTDDEGYTIHEARYGAGEWQLTANVYDQSDNIIKSWDARATAEIRQPNSAYTNIDAAATITKYNSSDIKDAAGNVVVPARTRVTDVYSPASMIAPTGSEVEEMIRKRVVTTYDEGAPTVGLSLPTKVKVTAERLNGSVVETLATTFTGYEKLETYDPKSGWDLRQATSTTLDMNGNGTADSADIRRETRYDARGRVNEQRQPGANTTAPGTRRTLYYTAATHPMDAACGGQPAWAGYVCTEGPASQPAGVTLPVTRYTNYAWHGASTTQTETSGAVTRTTTTTYDAKLRPITVATAVSGLASSSAIPTVTTSYDNATGNVTGTSSTAGSTALTYDNWGRQLTYTITPVGGTAETTTTAYNALGHVASVTTPKSSSVYTYDGTDANGTAEYRGLLTKIQTTANAQTWTATAGYDAQGQLTLEKLPGKINRTTMYDLTGELVSQEYAGVTAESPSTPVPWVAWSVRANAAGQIVNEWNPEAAAHSDELCQVSGLMEASKSRRRASDASTTEVSRRVA